MNNIIGHHKYKMIYGEKEIIIPKRKRAKGCGGRFYENPLPSSILRIKDLDKSLFIYKKKINNKIKPCNIYTKKILIDFKPDNHNQLYKNPLPSSILRI